MTASAIEVQRYLGDVDYPTDKQHLVEQARDHGAGDNVMQTLQHLPRDRFASPNDVTQAIGEPSKQRDIVEILLARHSDIKQMFTRVSAARAPQKEDLFHDLVRMLAVHENAEEVIVHPAARDLIPNGKEVVGERLHEESEAKRALADLYDLGIDHPEFDRHLSVLAESVVAHATEEEQQEFSQLRERADIDRLRRMATAFEAAEAVVPTRPHPAAGESAAVNLMVGPPTAVFDKIRDAMRDWRKRTGEG
jgi:hemerythrin superfamily protein